VNTRAKIAATTLILSVAMDATPFLDRLSSPHIEIRTFHPEPLLSYTTSSTATANVVGHVRSFMCDYL